jgi:succinate-acetate transporter protein
MKLDDYLGFAAFLSFGLWFLFFPRSVIAFYTWFHGGRVKMPAEFGVRLSGFLWIVLLSIIMVVTFHKK